MFELKVIDLLELGNSLDCCNSYLHAFSIFFCIFDPKKGFTDIMSKDLGSNAIGSNDIG